MPLSEPVNSIMLRRWVTTVLYHACIGSHVRITRVGSFRVVRVTVTEPKTTDDDGLGPRFVIDDSTPGYFSVRRLLNVVDATDVLSDIITHRKSFINIESKAGAIRYYALNLFPDPEDREPLGRDGP